MSLQLDCSYHSQRIVVMFDSDFQDKTGPLLDLAMYGLVARSEFESWLFKHLYMACLTNVRVILFGPLLAKTVSEA